MCYNFHYNIFVFSTRSQCAEAGTVRTTLHTFWSLTVLRSALTGSQPYHTIGRSARAPGRTAPHQATSRARGGLGPLTRSSPATRRDATQPGARALRATLHLTTRSAAAQLQRRTCRDPQWESYKFNVGKSLSLASASLHAASPLMRAELTLRER